MNSAKLNRQRVGYLFGILLPLLVLAVIFFTMYTGKSFWAFLQIMWIQGNLSQVLSLAVIPNLAIFFIFIWTKKLKTAQGVLGATFILAFLIIILRFAR